MEKIIWEGEKLTLEELKALCEKHFEFKNEDAEWNPEKNDNVIAIVRQPDGNYKGYAKKNGKLVQVRTNDPQIAMVQLITHA